MTHPLPNYLIVKIFNCIACRIADVHSLFEFVRCFGGVCREWRSLLFDRVNYARLKCRALEHLGAFESLLALGGFQSIEIDLDISNSCSSRSPAIYFDPMDLKDFQRHLTSVRVDVECLSDVQSLITRSRALKDLTVRYLTDQLSPSLLQLEGLTKELGKTPWNETTNVPNIHLSIESLPFGEVDVASGWRPLNISTLELIFAPMAYSSLSAIMDNLCQIRVLRFLSCTIQMNEGGDDENLLDAYENILPVITTNKSLVQVCFDLKFLDTSHTRHDQLRMSTLIDLFNRNKTLEVFSLNTSNAVSIINDSTQRIKNTTLQSLEFKHSNQDSLLELWTDSNLSTIKHPVPMKSFYSLPSFGSLHSLSVANSVAPVAQPSSSNISLIFPKLKKLCFEFEGVEFRLPQDQATRPLFLNLISPLFALRKIVLNNTDIHDVGLLVNLKHPTITTLIAKTVNSRLKKHPESVLQLLCGNSVITRFKLVHSCFDTHQHYTQSQLVNQVISILKSNSSLEKFTFSTNIISHFAISKVDSDSLKEQIQHSIYLKRLSIFSKEQCKNENRDLLRFLKRNLIKY